MANYDARQLTANGLWHQLRDFTVLWSAMLQRSMTGTGRGYKRESLRHTGKGSDRRRDKLDGMPKRFRQYRNRYGP